MRAIKFLYNLTVYILLLFLCPLKISAGIQLDSLLRILSNASSISERQSVKFKIARYYYDEEKYTEAIRFYKESLDEAQISGNKSVITDIKCELGKVYGEMVVLDKSLEYLLPALKQYEKNGNKFGISTCYTYIGNAYTIQKMFKEALEYYKKAFEYAQLTNDKNIMANAYKDLADGEDNVDNSRKSIPLYHKAIQLYAETGNNSGLSKVYNNLGTIHYYLSDYSQALYYYRKSLEIKYKFNSKHGIANTLDNIGKIYLSRNHLDSALWYFNKSYVLSRQIGAFDIEKNACLHLSQLYEKKGDVTQCLSYFKLYHVYNDTLRMNQNHSRIHELQAAYDTEKKENEIFYLKKENEKQKIIAISSIIFLLFLVIIIILVYRQYRLKKESNRILNIQKQEITLQNQKLAEQADKLKELDEVKSRFFSNISHEFRTPLTLILGPAQQLAANLEDKKNKEASSLIVRNAQRLLTLINQLLDISRIERGRMKLKAEFGDICSFVRTRVTIFSSLAEEKQISFSYFVPHEIHNTLYDPDKLEKIIYNLLSNAFKFTPANKSITVKFDLNDNNTRFTLTVSDTGIGIAEDQLSHIFDRFYQAKNQQTYPQEGSGIGLALVKELVEIYRGTITAESSLNQGSRFKVTLPCDKSLFMESEILSEQALTESSQPVIDAAMETRSDKFTEKEENKNQPLILLVEDNTDMRLYIRSSLMHAYRVIEAKDGAEGLEVAGKEGPDLVISDVMMPNMDGFEFTSKVKQQAETSHIPVILLTAKTAEESKLKGLACEADDYLTKPFSVKELQARIQNLIHLREKLRDKFSKSIVVNPSEITTTSLDEQFLQAALLAVERNMDNPEFTAEQLCSETNVSRANMHRKLKALTNQSATEFIRSIRLKRAAQLLEQQSGNVSEVATKVGFNTLSYFTACFKEQFNCLPSEYQK